MTYSIITNNCYGTHYYYDNKYEYKTPFIGLFLFAPCYITFLENYNEYIKQELIQINESKYGNFTYPVGRIGESEIHFLHEKDFQEAKIKWDRRKDRLDDFNNCIIKMCDRDLINKDIIQRFINLNHPHKILFISKKWKKIKYKLGMNIIKTKYKYECPDGYKLYRDYPIVQYLPYYNVDN